MLNFWHHALFFFDFPCYNDLLSYAVNVLGFEAYNDLVPLNHTHNPVQTKPEVVAATCKKRKKKICVYRTLLWSKLDGYFPPLGWVISRRGKWVKEPEPFVE